MAPPLTTEQKTQIVEWFLQTNSIVTVQRRFKNQYKCKETPARNTVKTLVEQFRATGNVTGKKRGRSKLCVCMPSTVGTNRASVASSPTQKCAIAAEYEVSLSTAWCILRTYLRVHPYKIDVFQSLTAVCWEKRTRFVEEFSDHLQQNTDEQSVQHCSLNSAWTEGEDQGKLRTGHKRNAHLCCTELCITSWSSSRVPRGSLRARHLQHYLYVKF
jgi:hypothetical protein